MLVSRPPVFSWGRRRASRGICASCFFQRVLSTATRGQQAKESKPTQTQKTQKTESSQPEQPTDTETATKTKPIRKPRRPRLPQPGPPDPPWPKPRSAQDKDKAPPRPFMSPSALAKNMVMITGMRGAFFPPAGEAAAGDGIDNDNDVSAMLSLGVPRLPDPDTDYTEIGPGVVAPWQPGGAAFRPPADDSDGNGNGNGSATRALGGPKRMGVKLRICDAHVMHPYSVKFLEGSADIAPAGPAYASSVGGPSGLKLHSGVIDGGAATALPHCLSEVVRRWYANKNRTDPLWWYVGLIANDNAGGADLATIKNVVRSKTHAKVQHAFKTALARRGYSPVGVRLVGGDNKTAAAAALHPHLFGTVRIDAVLQRVLEAPYDDLVTYMTGLLAGVEAELGSQGRVVDGTVVYAGPKITGARMRKRMPARPKY